jgi:hypothetical protein
MKKLLVDAVIDYTSDMELVRNLALGEEPVQGMVANKKQRYACLCKLRK